MNKKIVVTGAAGFIGGHLCRKLLIEHECSVIGIDNLRSGDWSRTPDKVLRIERDLSDFSQNELNELLKGVDILFHLAAEKYNSSKSTPEKLFQTNVLATERLFRAAALNNVGRTVFTSSLYAYGSMGPTIMNEEQVPLPVTLYGASKLMGEGILRSTDREIGLSWNVARLFFIYGPNQHAEGGYKSVVLGNFEKIIANSPPTINGDGEQSLDYVYIEDCIEALMTLATDERDREIVNVSSGTGISIKDLTGYMLNIAKSNLHPITQTSDWTKGSVRVGSTDAMKSKFDWQTKVSPISGLAKVYDWLQKL